jgi:small subunit ribosomal protein S17
MADETENENVTPADETPPVVEETPVEETTPEAPAAEADAPVETTPATDAPAAEQPAIADAPPEAAAAAPEPAPAAAAEASPAAAPEAAVQNPPREKRPKSQRHVPRSQRRQRSKPAREKPAERKPIVRLEKPEKELGRRQERRGVVVSNAMDKTIVVQVEVIKIHQRYKKVIRRSRKFHAHDERNEANVGDVVRIVETRPLSKTKTWRLAEVVQVAR